MDDNTQTMDEAVPEETGVGLFQTRVRTAGVVILAYEPVAAGEFGSGPTPYQLLAAALASCTTMTLRLYATRKGRPVHRIRTAVGHSRDAPTVPAGRFTRRIAVEGDLDAVQQTRLIEIADRCPVHRTLTGGARVETLAGHAPPPAQRATDHAVDMEALIAVGRGSFDFVQ